MDAGVLFLVALAAVGAVVLLLGLKIVGPEEAGTVVTLGRPGKNVKSGIYWVFPVLQWIDTIDKRKQKLNPSWGDVLTQDMIPVRVDLVLTAQVVDPKKAQFNIEDPLGTALLLIQAMLVRVLGTVPAYKAVSDPDVRGKIAHELDTVAQRIEASFGLNLADYELQALRLPPALEQAITDQRAADHRKQEMIILAEGEAKATQIERGAQDPYWPEKVRWDAAVTMAREGKAPIVIMDGGGGAGGGSSQQSSLLAALLAKLDEIHKALQGGNR